MRVFSCIFCSSPCLALSPATRYIHVRKVTESCEWSQEYRGCFELKERVGVGKKDEEDEEKEEDQEGCLQTSSSLA